MNRPGAAMLVCLFYLPGLARADVKPAGLFADHMVLQSDAKVPVWGTADAGEKILVSIGSRKVEAVANADGRWLTRLDALAAGGPFEMTISGSKNAVTLKDVLVGEVWIAGGQSNMDMHVSQAAGGDAAAAAANDSQIRFFRVGGALPLEPAKDVRGEWQLCKPENVKDWSAAGYYFAEDLRKSRKSPIGIIQNAVGWTVAEAWTSRATLAGDPDLKPILDRWDHWTAAYPNAKSIYDKQHADWQAAAEKAKAANQPAPPEPPAPANPEFIHAATRLYNGMVAPLMPYAMKGVIWYQGETNASRADQYRRLFPAMIADWRRSWASAGSVDGDFPFIFVQIAPLDAGPVDRAELRDAQRETLAKVKKTAMVVTVDIGEQKDEHPKNKREIGRRLALAAEKLAYGRNVIASGPSYSAMKIEGSAIRLTFTDLGGGLASKENGPLVGFIIAGEDQKFLPAEARIDCETVIVSSKQVEHPIAVRYAFANWPQYSLFNKAGLPASPFRTDDWPLTTKGETKMFYDQIGLDDVTLTPKQK